MFTTEGIITYEAGRNFEGVSTWWLTVELPKFRDTANYYRWFIDREWYNADTRPVKRKYNMSSHPPHISVIRGEAPRDNKSDWGRFMSGRKVEVQYSNVIRQTKLDIDGSDHFWFVDANIKDYVALRKHYGLEYQRGGKPFRGHITIARAY